MDYAVNSLLWGLFLLTPLLLLKKRRVDRSDEFSLGRMMLVVSVTYLCLPLISTRLYSVE